MTRNKITLEPPTRKRMTSFKKEQFNRKQTMTILKQSQSIKVLSIQETGQDVEKA